MNFKLKCIALSILFLINVGYCGECQLAPASHPDNNVSKPIMDYLSFSSYYSLIPIWEKGYFKIARRYIHPPIVEWGHVPSVSRYELILIQDNQVLGVTPAISSPKKIEKGWDATKPGRAAIFIQGFDADNKKIALSQLFPFYIAPDFEVVNASKAKYSYRQAALKAFNALYDYEIPQKNESAKELDGKVLPVLLGAAEFKSGLFSYSFPCLHDWIHVEMLLAMHKIADEKLKEKIIKYAYSVGEHLLMCRIQNEDYIYKNMIRGCANWSGGPAVGIIGSKDERDQRLVEPSKCGYPAEALVKVYELTKDKKYLDAAVQIAEVLVKTQLNDGSWPARVDAKNGEVFCDYSTSVTSVVSFLERLNQHCPDNRWTQTSKHALEWLIKYPAKTHAWVVNYDDGGSGATKENPYSGLSNWDLFAFVRYLAKNSDKIENAAYYIQNNLEWNDNHFVFYGSDPLLPFDPYYPCVAEQGNPTFYPNNMWTPMDFHTANWALALLDAWRATQNVEYLHKAKAAGNTLTQYQLDNGRTITFMFDRVSGLIAGIWGSPSSEQFWPGGWAMSAWLWAELAAIEQE